jgi:Fis family transcriptional regulator, factor for inversion stimulation protein
MNFGLILLCIKQPGVMIMDDTLREAVRKIATNYLEGLPEEDIANVYKLFLSEMERGLLPAVMEKTSGNQSKAAQWLGINRGTFGKKWRLAQD